MLVRSGARRGAARASQSHEPAAVPRRSRPKAVSAPASSLFAQPTLDAAAHITTIPRSSAFSSAGVTRTWTQTAPQIFRESDALQRRMGVVYYRLRKRPKTVAKLQPNPQAAKEAHEKIQQLISDGETRQAIAVFDNLRVSGILPELATYKSILHAFEDIADIEGLIETYEDIKANKIELDHDSLCLVLDTYIMRGKKKEAEEIFRALATPDLYAYQRICEMYILSRDKPNATKIIQEMKSKNFSLDPTITELYAQLKDG